MKKRMIKIGCIAFLAALLWMRPLEAKANNASVTIEDASADTVSVSVEGTTSALAVMVQIRDASDTILKMESFGTKNEEFSGTLENMSLTAGSTYTVYVADYEGGPWSTQEVVAQSTSNPKSHHKSKHNNASGEANAEEPAAETQIVETPASESVTATTPGTKAKENPSENQSVENDKNAEESKKEAVNSSKNDGETADESDVSEQKEQVSDDSEEEVPEVPAMNVAKEDSGISAGIVVIIILAVIAAIGGAAIAIVMKKKKEE